MNKYNRLSSIKGHSLTHSKHWRWSWTSGETPLLSPHSPSWTALWLQWNHSGSWAPQFLRTWSGTITLSPLWKRPSRRLYFLRQLRKFNLPQELLKQFYSAIIESVLCTSITVWFSSATKSDLRRLRRVVRTAERIIGTTLPTLRELYLSRVSKRAGKITLDPSHPAHSLFELLPSGQRYRALSTRTTRHRTVSSPKQSISWTLDIKHGTHNTIYIIYSSHILIFFISNLHISDLYTHNCLYYIWCFCYFVHCLFVYLYIILYYLCLVLLLSFCCTVELLSV